MLTSDTEAAAPSRLFWTALAHEGAGREPQANNDEHPVNPWPVDGVEGDVQDQQQRGQNDQSPEDLRYRLRGPWRP